MPVYFLFFTLQLEETIITAVIIFCSCFAFLVLTQRRNLLDTAMNILSTNYCFVLELSHKLVIVFFRLAKDIGQTFYHNSLTDKLFNKKNALKTSIIHGFSVLKKQLLGLFLAIFILDGFLIWNITKHVMCC